MQRYGDYTFSREELPATTDLDGPDYSTLGKPALYTPRELVAVVALAIGVGAVVVATLLVLFG